jgi:hypothetical protein
MNMSKSFWGGDHVPSINISLVAATLWALTVSVKSLHVLGTVQTGAPSTEPLVFVMSVSVYVMVGLAGLSVPLAAGDGALGAFGPAAVGAFRGPNVIVVDEAAVDEALFIDRVRLLLAKVSERKKQLLITSTMAMNIRQFDVLISSRILMGSFLEFNDVLAEMI